MLYEYFIFKINDIYRVKFQNIVLDTQCLDFHIITIYQNKTISNVSI